MPILMSVDQLKPGMCLAANVVNQFSVLLPHGHKLTGSNIASLRSKLPHLCVKISDPLLDDFADFQDDCQDQEVSRHVRRNVSSVIEKVSKNISSSVALTADHVSGMEEVVKEMMEYLRQHPVTVGMIDQTNSWDDYLKEHSANVFYLAMLIGNAIRNYVKNERERLSAAKIITGAMNLTPLGTAALFHDLGMVPLERLYSKTEPLTQEEIDAIRQHPAAGAQMLPEEIDPMVRLTVRCHHENHDGSGYPDGLTSENTTVFSRIIRIADAYSAAIADKAYRPSKSPVCAMYEMLQGAYRQLYDPVPLKIFASIVKPFPIGAKLQLESGQCAVVVRHGSDPFNPEIVVAFDELGDPLPREALERSKPLHDRRDIKVVSFGEEDISFLNDRQPAGAQRGAAADESDLGVFDLAYP